ncbi:hypothetical protein D9M72_417190 [compost metagenome]
MRPPTYGAGSSFTAAANLAAWRCHNRLVEAKFIPGVGAVSRETAECQFPLLVRSISLDEAPAALAESRRYKAIASRSDLRRIHTCFENIRLSENLTSGGQPFSPKSCLRLTLFHVKRSGDQGVPTPDPAAALVWREPSSPPSDGRGGFQLGKHRRQNHSSMGAARSKSLGRRCGRYRQFMEYGICGHDACCGGHPSDFKSSEVSPTGQAYPSLTQGGDHGRRNPPRLSRRPANISFRPQ